MIFRQILENHPSYAYIFPELMLIGAGLLMLFLDLFLKESRKAAGAYVGLIALALSMLYLHSPVIYDKSHVTSFLTNMITDDGYTVFFKYIFLVGAFIVIVISLRYTNLDKYKGEYYALIILSIPGMMFISSAVNLLLIYLGIEYIGVCCYILCAFHKNDKKATEGAIKYLLLGALASAFLLYGSGILYGMTGSLNVGEITRRVNALGPDKQKIILVSLVMMMTGFGFKVAMVPFHYWAPDAYEGAPTSVTAFFSVLPKAAGMAVLIRIMVTIYSSVGGEMVRMVEVLAILTMTVGNIVAIWQTDIKRMLAYSGIAHVGYILISLVVAGIYGIGSTLGKQSIASVLIYLAIYVLMNLGAFTVIIMVSNTIKSYNIEDYAGLGKRNAFAAIALTFFLLSLAGIPPTAGFIGKFFIFKAAIEGKMYLLAIFGIVNSVISLYYYWNVVRLMFIKEPSEQSTFRPAFSLSATVVVTLVAIFALGLFFTPLIRMASGAVLLP